MNLAKYSIRSDRGGKRTGPVPNSYTGRRGLSSARSPFSRDRACGLGVLPDHGVVRCQDPRVQHLLLDLLDPARASDPSATLLGGLHLARRRCRRIFPGRGAGGHQGGCHQRDPLPRLWPAQAAGAGAGRRGWHASAPARYLASDAVRRHRRRCVRGRDAAHRHGYNATPALARTHPAL